MLSVDKGNGWVEDARREKQMKKHVGCSWDNVWSVSQQETILKVWYLVKQVTADNESSVQRFPINGNTINNTPNGSGDLTYLK